ncbi:hypothetical protein Mapa_002178 [Marchantia paleacea]|nr:hypothetical protein Mapa_002178 [Marchantia paleacea]
MHRASHRPFPSMRRTCAYSCPSSLKTSSLFSSSASFFPLFRFFPPFPLFFGILSQALPVKLSPPIYAQHHLADACRRLDLKLEVTRASGHAMNFRSRKESQVSQFHHQEHQKKEHKLRVQETHPLQEFSNFPLAHQPRIECMHGIAVGDAPLPDWHAPVP